MPYYSINPSESGEIVFRNNVFASRRYFHLNLPSPIQSIQKLSSRLQIVHNGQKLDTLAESHQYRNKSVFTVRQWAVNSPTPPEQQHSVRPTSLVREVPWYSIPCVILHCSIADSDCLRRHQISWLYLLIVRVPRPDFGPYPALRVKVFFFADSGSLDGMLQFPGGWPSITLEQFSESTRLCWAYTV